MFKPKPPKLVLPRLTLYSRPVVKGKLSRFRPPIYLQSVIALVSSRQAYVRGVIWSAALIAIAIGATLLTSPAHAATPTLSFQARLQTNTGAIAPDGTYNVRFKLYEGGTASGGGTQMWTEDHIYGTPDNRVRVANGYLSVNLGSITAFPTTINWDDDLFLSMTIGGIGTTPSWDSEMSPYLKLTAVPYAFQSQSASQLQTEQGGYTGTLDFSSLTNNQSIHLPNASGTVCLQGSSSCSFASASGSGSYIQNQNSSAQTGADFWIDGTGKAANFNAVTALQTNGTTRIDATGNLTNIGNISGNGTLQLSGTTGSSYIMSALGLGTTSPQASAALTIANGSWIGSVDSAGTGYVNMFQVNASNQIQVGAALNIDGGIVLPTDGGQLTFSDLPIDSTATAGTPESYTMRVGSTNALTVYGEADGSGNAQNIRVAIGSSIAPGYTLDVGGDVNSSTGYRVGGTAGSTVTCSSGQYLQSQVLKGGITTGGSCASDTGVTGVGTIDGGTYSDNGASISGSTIYLQSANASHTGLVTYGDQTFAGNKTFNGSVLTSTLDSKVSGTLSVGTANATALTIGKTGITTALQGNVSIGTTSSDRLTLNSQILGGSLVFQGATDDSYTTTLNISDPTGNRTITLPNNSGVIVLNTSGSSVNGTSGFVQGGQTWGSDANLGTADAYALNLMTNGNTRLSVDATGKVGVGTAPAYQFDVAGDINTSTGYRVGGAAGSSTTCTAGQYLDGTKIQGGIVTLGTCTAVPTGSGVTSVGSLDGGTYSDNGASISADGTTLYLQAAGLNHTGLVTYGDQTFGGNKTFTGSVLTSTIDTATATTLSLGSTNAMAINLNQNTSLAAGKTLTVTSGNTSLTGGATGDALTVSNSTSTGNILVLKDNTTPVMTVADGGAVTFQNSVDSSSALQIKNANNDVLLNFDSTVGALGIGVTSPLAPLHVGLENGGPYIDGFEDDTLSPFTTDGDALFSVVNSNARTGVYSVKSGQPPASATGLSSNLYLTRTLAAPGTITFWKKLSNLNGYTYAFYIDGVKQESTTTSNSTYTMSSFPVGAGTHTFKWSYLTGASPGAGYYLDDITVTNNQASATSAIFNGNVGIGTTLPQFLLDVNAGQSATSWLGVSSDGSDNLQGGLLLNQGSSYGFQEAVKNTSGSSGLLSFDYKKIVDGSTVQPSILTLNSKGFVGIGTSGASAALDVSAQSGLYTDGFESGVLPPFTTDGDALFSVVQNNASTGAFSAKSGQPAPCACSHTSNLYLTKTLSSPGTVSFSKKLSNLSGYTYAFYIDGVMQESTTASKSSYTTSSFAVAAGTHTFKWSYQTGASPGAGFYIDDVTVSNTTDTVNALLVHGGNVGIGTYTPGYMLDVAGDINTTTGYRFGGTLGATTTCAAGQYLDGTKVQGGIVTAGTCTAVPSGGTGGITTIGTIDGGTYSDNGASISADGTTLYLQAATGSHTGLVTHGDQTFGGNKTFTGNILANGSLTIGTASSTGLLKLNDGAGQTATIESAAQTGSYSYTLPATPGNDIICLKTLANCTSSGSTDVNSVNSLTGALTLQGTTGQVTVTDNGTDTMTVALNSSVTLQGNTFNGAGQLVQLNSSTQLPAVSGQLLTNLNGSNIASGTVSVAYGGTGANSSQAAINNLSQLTTTGDLLYYDGTNSTRLARGTGGQCLNSTATSIQWGSCGLTSEADTLATVTARGATTATASSFTGGATIRGLIVDTATATQDRILVSAAAVGSARFDGTVTNADLTAARTWTLPNASGTVITTGNLSNITSVGTITSTITSSVVTGTAPLSVASTTKVTNLNADQLDGIDSAAFVQNQNTAAQSAFNFWIDGTGKAAIFNATSGFQINGTAGASVTCSGGQVLQNQVVAGGIVTGGSCVTLGTGGSGGINTIGLLGAGSYSSNGASISADGTTLYMQIASSSQVGLVTSGDQTFGGNKHFKGQTYVANDSAAAFTVQNANQTQSLLTADTTSWQLSVSGVIGSTVANGTAPLNITSSTKVTNLNVDKLDGIDSTGFIINQTSSAQSVASFWIDGTGKAAIFNATSGFQINGTAGKDLTCGAGTFLQTPTIAGGIITDGTCATGGGGGSGVSSLNTLTGALTIQGTANEITVNAAGTTITLSTPQAINTTSSVQFGSLLVGDATNGITLSATGLLASGTAQHTKEIKLTPEFPGTVFATNGGSNIGYMTSDYDSTRGNYYAWTTDQGAAENYDIVTQYQLPSDFNGFVSGTFKLWDYVDTGGSLSYMIKDASGTSCYASFQTAGSSTSAWYQATMTAPANGCSFAANDVITFIFRPSSNSTDGSLFTKLSTVQFDYKAKF